MITFRVTNQYLPQYMMVIEEMQQKGFSLIDRLTVHYYRDEKDDAVIHCSYDWRLNGSNGWLLVFTSTTPEALLYRAPELIFV
jgi:hypothetical protein